MRVLTGVIDLFATERKRAILDWLTEKGKVKVVELSEAFDVSEPTIRRDIKELDEKGLLIRTHGGAIALEEREHEPSFHEKQDKFHKEKESIGKLAASLIKDGDTLLLDSGTTTLQIAKELNAKGITVVTNSLDIAYELEKKQEIEVVLTGGIMRWNTRAMVGAVADEALKRFHVDVAFLGTNYISIEGGLTTHNMMEATTKSNMIKIAKKVFVVCDHTKFDKTTFYQIASLDDLDGIITDSGMSQEMMQRYEQEDLDIIIE